MDSEAAQAASSAANVHYVYALVRRPGKFALEDVFYIGKGKALRALSHFEAAKKDLYASAKIDQIKSILGDEATVDTIEAHCYVLVGDLSERDAYNVESLFIKMLGGPLGPQLLNLQRGHGRQETPLLVPVADARIYFDAVEEHVDRVSSEQLASLRVNDGRTLVILVKGGTAAIDEPASVITQEAGPIDRSVRVKYVEQVRTLRGWSPETPWTHNEAAERASVWWPISQANVGHIRRIAERVNVEVALLVRDPRSGSSVVRYAWSLDPQKNWLFDGKRWGLPLGQALEEHPWRGLKLLRSDNSRQILVGNASGIGYALRDSSRETGN